jgi:hypothetical protein
MEIIQIDKCNISDDIIIYKLKEWIDFHKSNKILDINNFEKNDNKEYDYDINDYNIYTKIYENTTSKFQYIIKYNNELIGTAIIDIRYNATEIYIKNLLLSNNNDWYDTIYNIINYYNKDNNEYIYINFHDIMIHHPIINNIMKYFNGVLLLEFDDNYYYVIKLKKYNYQYDKKIQLEIIGYKDQKKQNIVLNHNSNIGVLFTLKSQYDYPLCNKYKPTKQLQDIHFRSEYNIILEKPIIDIYVGDIFIDFYIIYENQKFKLNNNEPYDLRLNEMSKYSDTLTYTSSCINSLKCYYNNCSCLYCKEQLNKFIKDNIKLDKYYYGSSTSNYLLYNFIDDILKSSRYTKKCNYGRTTINKPNSKLNLLSLNILDLSYIYNNKINTILNTEYNYIYLIQKYDVNLKKDLYKFGKTNRHFNERIKEHGREAKVLIILDVENCNIIETHILKVLRSDIKINERKDIGNEYFYCDDKQYIINLILKNIY